MGAAYQQVRDRITFLEENGLFAEAVAFVRSRILLDAQAAPLLQVRLVILLAKLGRHEEVVQQLEALPAHLGRQVPLLLIAARSYLDLGQHQKAAEYQLEAFKLEPNYHRGRSLLVTLLASDRLQDAGQVARRLFELRGDDLARVVELLDAVDDVVSFSELLRAICTGQESKIDALRLREPRAQMLADVIFESAELLMGAKPSANHIKSFKTIAAILGRMDAAVEVFTHLKDPGFSVHASLSDIYAKQGDIAQAKSAYHRAMAADSQLDPVQPVQDLDGVPIIFLHRGDADFFRVAQEQARLWNPERRIIVIGDDYNRVDGIEYHRWADYRDGADALVEAYQHRTVNTFPFEILCLERWLVLRTFCKAHGLDEVIHLDSDVLVFESFDDSLPSLREKAAAVCGVQAGVAYFTYSELSIVSDTLMQVMGNPEQFEDFVICNDMDLIGRTARERGWHDLLVPVDDVVFDNHIHTSDGFDFEDGRKRFEFFGGQPYSNHAPSGVRMRFRAIHFQGSAKLLMSDYVKRAHASM